MLKHAYDYSEYRVLLLSCGGEVLSGPEYIITGLEDLLAERLAEGDESFMVGEHLLHAHIVPSLQDKYKVPPLSLASASLFSKKATGSATMEEELRRTGSSYEEKQKTLIREDDVMRSIGEDSSTSRMTDPSTASRLLHKSQRFNNKDDQFAVSQNEDRRNEFLRRRQQLITEMWNLDPVDGEAQDLHTEQKERKAREEKLRQKEEEQARLAARRRPGAGGGQSAAAEAMAESAAQRGGGGTAGAVLGPQGADELEAKRKTTASPGAKQAKPKSRPGSPGQNGAEDNVEKKTSPSQSQKRPKTRSPGSSSPKAKFAVNDGTQPDDDDVMELHRTTSRDEEAPVEQDDELHQKTESELLDEADSVWDEEPLPGKGANYYESNEFLNRPTRWRKYCRETYLDQVHRGVQIMEEFFLGRRVPPDHIYKYDFSQVSDEHPQDILEAFLQMEGKKFVYYVGHTSLDGGWFFTWRNSVGMPDNWILRPSDFEFGPPDRCGTPFVIVDGSYTSCWMEPSCKFITLACLDGAANGGGRRGPLLTRAMTGIDVQEMLRPMAEAPPAKEKKDMFALKFASDDSDGSLSMVRESVHEKGPAHFWHEYNRKYGDAFRESDTYLPAPAGTKIRIDDNYEDSVVIRLPLYIVLYNRPTMDAVWSLRAVLEVANHTELMKVRVFGILPLILLIIAGESTKISKTDINTFGGLATVKAGLGANLKEAEEDQNLIDALEGGGMSEDAVAALEKSKQVVAAGKTSKLGKKRQQLEKEEGERQSFAKGDKTWMFKTEQDASYKAQKEVLPQVAEEEEAMFGEEDDGALDPELAKQLSGADNTPTRRHHSPTKSAALANYASSGSGGKMKSHKLTDSAEQAFMRQEAVLVLGLIAPVLRLDELEKQALPVLTQYTSDTNNRCGWKVLAKLGQSFRNNQKLGLDARGAEEQPRLMKIRTRISAKTWRDQLEELYTDKTEAVGQCGPNLVAVDPEQLVQDCQRSLSALVQLNAGLPRWCRMENLDEARLGCRLLAEGPVVNPKLCFKTCMSYPFDPDVLRWGLLALSRGGFHLLDPETAYVPVVNALTLKANNLQHTFASASVCFERFLANGLWGACNIWDTCRMFIRIICERGCADQVCKGLLAACTSLHKRFLQDGEAPLSFTWRPLTEFLLNTKRQLKIHQKTLDTLITTLAVIVEYERKRGHHTNGNSLAIDLVNHWDEFLSRATVQEVIPAYRYLTRVMKEVFYQPEELAEIARKEKEAQQLRLGEEDKGKKKKKKGGKKKE
ncbi:unnamed protein product [Amoebophrya sp. A120]|nr:unnamed protein product [Amoebophrya sp. A120]|eukprot:GSA120T00017477001.1